MVATGTGGADFAVGANDMEEKIEGNTFRASGDAATMAAHERLVIHHNKMMVIREAVPYGAAVAFALIAALLIIFAPESRNVAANIVAGALFALACSIAGYTRFSAKVAGMKFEGSGHAPS